MMTNLPAPTVRIDRALAQAIDAHDADPRCDIALAIELPGELTRAGTRGVREVLACHGIIAGFRTRPVAGEVAELVLLDVIEPADLVPPPANRAERRRAARRARRARAR